MQNSKFNGLLISRFAVLNLTGFILAGAAFHVGYAQQILNADVSHITYVIVAVFGVLLTMTGWRAFKIAKEIDRVRSGTSSRRVVGQDGAKAMELRLFSRISFVRFGANMLVVMGLIGTVVGMVHAFSSIDASMVSSADQVGKLLTVLINAMGVALSTTLVGSILSLWLSANHQMLSTATASLIAAILEREDEGQYFTVPGKADEVWSFGKEDFTAEGWVHLNAKRRDITDKWTEVLPEKE